MALIADAHFVKETTTTTGSMGVGGTIALAGAESGFNSFSNGIGTGHSCIATLRFNAVWMVFYAELTTASTLIIRGLIETSAGGQTPLTLGAGTKYVYISPVPALMRMASTTGLDNAFINPCLNVWQRGTTFASVANLAYTADRFKVAYSGAMGMTINRSTSVPTITQAGMKLSYSLEVDVTTAVTPIGASEYAAVFQIIEGFRWAAFAQQKLTISFWVYSSKTGTHCVSVVNAGLDRSFIGTYTVNVANTWEYKSVQFSASPSAGTWDYTTGIGLTVRWILACGTTYHNSANSWLSTNSLATSAQVNVFDSTANFFRVTGITLQVGNTPSGLIAKDQGGDLIECQRYYQQGFLYYQGYAAAGGTSFYVSHPLRTVMRGTPTITKSNTTFTNCTDGGATANTLAIWNVATSTGAGVWSQIFDYAASAEL